MGVCRVAVGSTNPVKVNAVRRALRLLCEAVVEGVAVESGVPVQPIGLDEVLRGAISRALEAQKRLSADYGVGVEAGLVEYVEPLELQVAVVVDSNGGVSIGFSPAFPIPRSWLPELRRRVELGEIATRVTGRRDIGERLGIIGYLTRGLVTRTDLTYLAVLMALVPRLNPDLYTELPHYTELLSGGENL